MSDMSTVEVDRVHPEIFGQLLKYIYTGSCDLLAVGKPFAMTSCLRQCDDTEMNVNGTFVPYDQMISAYEVHQNEKKKNKRKEKNAREKQMKHDKMGKNPITLLQDVAKRFGIKALVKK